MWIVDDERTGEGSSILVKREASCADAEKTQTRMSSGRPTVVVDGNGVPTQIVVPAADRPTSSDGRSGEDPG